MKLQLYKTLVIFMVLSALSGCTSMPHIYSGDAIEGWVIDSKTKEPIEGVVVVEIWGLEGGFHPDHTANIHIAETITDKKGYYSFSSWGPKLTVQGTMGSFAPRLVFYKFGYEDVRLSNKVGGYPPADYRVSQYNGEKIEFVKFNGSAEEYNKSLGSIHYLLNIQHTKDNFKCMWVMVPVFTSEMIKLSKYFWERKISNSFPRLEGIDDCNGRSARVILKDYLK